MFYGAISIGFVYWIFFGVALVILVMGLKDWAKSRRVKLTWWKWVIATCCYVLMMMMLGAPFTIMGEGEVAAGWRMLAFHVPIIIITGFVAYRVLVLGRSR